MYAKLEEYNIAVPNYIVVNRDQPNEDVDTFIEDEDWIELNGKRVHKPFVEKPVDGKVPLSAATDSRFPLQT